MYLFNYDTLRPPLPLTGNDSKCLDMLSIIITHDAPLCWDFHCFHTIWFTGVGPTRWGNFTGMSHIEKENVSFIFPQTLQVNENSQTSTTWGLKSDSVPQEAHRACHVYHVGLKQSNYTGVNHVVDRVQCFFSNF